jgi:hypothetical protein
MELLQINVFSLLIKIFKIHLVQIICKKVHKNQSDVKQTNLFHVDRWKKGETDLNMLRKTFRKFPPKNPKIEIK